VVAASLAGAFARADTEVVLVGANAPEPGTPPLSQLFDVADIPGLSDVLSGRVALPAALQRAARLPRLRVITPGGTASAAGLLQSEGARSAVQALRRQARYIVVEAPSTAAGADAQSLARVADAAILVVEAGRSRPAQVADAAEQLRLVGTRLLGAVLLSPPMPVPDERERPRPLGGPDEWFAQTPPIVDAPTERLRQIHQPALDPFRRLIVRGQHAGEFRVDQPVEWMVTVLFALLHAAPTASRSPQPHTAAELIYGSTLAAFQPTNTTPTTTARPTPRRPSSGRP
jgi:hypothetical protein